MQPFLRNKRKILRNVRKGLVRLIGRGTYGKVYLATWPGDDGFVVVKMNDTRKGFCT